MVLSSLPRTRALLTLRMRCSSTGGRGDLVGWRYGGTQRSAQKARVAIGSENEARARDSLKSDGVVGEFCGEKTDHTTSPRRGVFAWSDFVRMRV